MKQSHLLIIVVLSVLVAIYFFSGLNPKLVNYPPKNDKIVAFGDSLIEGYGSTQGNDFVSVLSKKLNKPIVNLGISGNTTAEGMTRLDEVFNYNPGTVILLLGGNDYIRRVPKEETFANLRQMIFTLQSKGVFVVLLGVRGGAITDGYKGPFESLARDMGVAFVPDVLSGLIGDARYMSDVVHPNDEGYKKIAEKVYDTVGQYLK